MQKSAMTLAMIVSVAAGAAASAAAAAAAEGGASEVEPRFWSTVPLTGDNSNSVYYTFLFFIPIVVALVLLDFAIFGTFASRGDNLNPVSRFFFHAREGLDKVRRVGWSKRRRTGPGFLRPGGGRFRPSPARPEPHRVAR